MRILGWECELAPSTNAAEICWFLEWTVVRIFGEYGPHFTFIRGNLEPGSILFGFLEKL